MLNSPSESEIQRVMSEFGFDRLVAIRHLQGLRQLQVMLALRKPAFPLGKSAHFA